MFSMEKFNAWLLQELSKRNWSQSDLSYRANISRGTLSNILSGSRKIGTDVILAIARALHLPPEAVFRAAGILPPTPEADALTEEGLHILNQLEGEDKEEALRYLRLRREVQDERKKRHAGRKTQSARSG